MTWKVFGWKCTFVYSLRRECDWCSFLIIYTARLVKKLLKIKSSLSWRRITTVITPFFSRSSRFMKKASSDRPKRSGLVRANKSSAINSIVPPSSFVLCRARERFFFRGRSRVLSINSEEGRFCLSVNIGRAGRVYVLEVFLKDNFETRSIFLMDFFFYCTLRGCLFMECSFVCSICWLNKILRCV